MSNLDKEIDEILGINQHGLKGEVQFTTDQKEKLKSLIADREKRAYKQGWDSAGGETVMTQKEVEKMLEFVEEWLKTLGKDDILEEWKNTGKSKVMRDFTK